MNRLAQRIAPALSLLLGTALAMIGSYGCAEDELVVGSGTNADASGGKDGTVGDKDTGGGTDTDGTDAGGKDVVDAGDTGSKDVGDQDVPGDTAASCPGAPGCDCAADKDCDAGVCLEIPATGAKVCAAACSDSCDGDDVCLPVGTDGKLSVCVPPAGKSCFPCDSNDACSALAPDAACVDQGDAGRFCGNVCAADGDCPGDYACKPGTDVDGKTGSFCVPKDAGGCTCPAGAAGASTTCAVTNANGSCTGSRTCGDKGLTVCSAAVPAAETCNGTDDDCDGSTDEGIDCDDGNPCTTDSCDGAKGCIHTPKDGPCSDGDACAGKVCKDGTCSGGTAKNCDDGNPCTADTCDPATGACSASFLPDGATCTDGDACTENDGCAQGKCAGEPVDCDDGNPCTTDSCDGANGCAQAPLSSTAGKPIACEDGNPCTNGDACEKGACAPGAAVDCNDDNPCTADACDPISGQCSHPPSEGACDDGSLCTEEDACAAGVCAGKPKSCEDGNACTTNGCDPKIGCTLELNKAPCDDGNACTDFDACTGGKCKGALKDAADCDDNNPCTTDSCDLSAGCTSTANDKACDDGNPCTNGDVCSGGSCQAGQNLCACNSDSDCAGQNPDNICLGKLYCDKSQAPFACKLNPATVVTCPSGGDGPCAKNICEAKTGACAMVPAPDGKACDADGSVCTAGDACKSGTCAAGDSADCDDGNPCTTDACDPTKGCTHVANAAPCDADGNACTVGDACEGKVCVAGTKKSCDDGELCTIDSCDAKTGACANDGGPMDDKPCDADGSLCTSGDACKAGKCAAGAALACDDGNPCTDDSCSPSAGCLHAANSKACDADGNACTVGDACAAKVCVAGATKGCDDGDKCTTDACDAKTGVCSNTVILGCGGNCQSVTDCDDGNTCTADACKDGKCAYSPLTGDCDDGSACTSGDVCTDGKCTGAAITCNDGLLCTDDSCDAGSGCVYVANNKSCDDGDACTNADACKDGKCGGLAKKCDDGDDCTTDSCNPGDGSCNAKPIAGCGGYCVTAADCDDKNPCTDEQCQSGKCSSANNTDACDDGDLCTTSDVCGGGTCTGKPTACDDGNACTKDACDEKTGQCGAVALPKGATCDDDSACTTGDGCDEVNGKVTCVGKAKSCDDANACTTDSCDVATGGCKNVALANGSTCNDGQPCTFGESCQSGACKSSLSASIVTAAGSTQGFANGVGAAAKLNFPRDVAVLLGGDLVVADSANHVLRRVKPDGTTSTLAGQPGKPGLGDGKASEALLNQPWAVDVDPKGRIVFADLGTHTIRQMEGGVVKRLAGTGQAGYVDGAALTARFNGPHGVAIRKGGAIVVGDRDNHRIRQVDGDKVVTLAGSAGGFLDGPAATARFNRPQGVAIDVNGEIIIADTYNHRIRRLGHDGKVVTIAGSGSAGWLDGDAGLARFYYPWGVAVDSGGTIWISDRYNHRVRKLFAGKVGTTGGIGAGFQDGLVSVARLNYPSGIAVDAGGVIHVADGNNHRVRTHYPVDGIPWCFIAGACVRDGLPNAQSPCQSCVTAKSIEAWTNAANGTACIDGNLCTEKESCTDGVCKGASKTCDDGDKCTTDACDDASGGCVFKPIVGCGGNCGADKDCDDSNPCTDDACKAGKCANDANTAPCDDGEACTWGDTCKGGICVAGTATEVSTLAGSTSGYLDAKGAAARFKNPRAVGRAPDGTLWVADGGNHRIRVVAKDGTVTTLAGGAAGFADGPAKSALFNTPSDVLALPDGTMLVVDIGNQRLRKLKLDGTTSTLAGSTAGFADGKGSAARFYNPYGADVTPGGVIYVADFSNNRIRRVTADGIVTTVAGSGTGGYLNGTGTAARFNQPVDLTVLPNGNVAIADYANHRIRLMTPDGVVSNLAGSGTAGYVEGAPSSARFNYPWAVAADSAGRVVVSDRANQRIRRIATDGVVSRVASIGGGFADGDGDTVARFNSPWRLQLDADGAILLADYGNHRIRRIKESGKVCAIGGACILDGLVNTAQPCERCDVAKSKKAWTAQVDGAPCQDGAPCTLSDACSSGKCVSGDARVCDDKIACTKDSCDAKTGACVFDVIIGCGDYCETNAHCDDGNVCTTDVCVNTKCSWQNNAAACDDGDACTKGDVCSGGKCAAGTAVWVELLSGIGAGATDGAPDAARFNTPTGIALLGSGEVVVADRGNHRLRKVGTNGVVTTLAGSTAGFLDGSAAGARFNQPSDVDASAAGDLAIADLANHRVRLLSAGTVTTLAGGSAGWLDGPGSQARFTYPYGVAWSSGGALYVADYGNHRVRRIDIATQTVVTVAGDGSSGWLDGSDTSARLSGPIGIDVAADGSVYFGDYGTSRIRKLGIDGKVSTIAGDGQHGFINDVGTKARLDRPWGVVALPTGALVVADGSNQRLRHIDAAGSVTTWAGSGVAGYVNGEGAGARFYSPRGLAVAANGRIYVCDAANHRIRFAQATATPCSIGGVCWSAGWPSATESCERCDAKQSKSAFSKAVDGTACNDGKLCNAPDTCASGKCAGKTVVCNDGDDCTADSCDATTGSCVFKKIIGCKGYCETDAQCDDKNLCTTDVCNKNVCQSAPNTVQCDDGNACTVAERCQNGACTASTADTIVSTLAGSTAGWVDAKGILAKFSQPVGLALDATGTYWIADSNNHRIRTLAADGTVKTIAGSGKAGFVDGKGEAAWFYLPSDVDLHGSGVVVADRYNNRLRTVGADGTVGTLAGSSTAGYVDGKGGAAQFNQPIGVATLAGVAFVADFGNQRIRVVTPDGTTTTLAGSTYGYLDGKGAAARFQYPIGIAVDAGGVAYVTEWDGHRVRRVAVDGTVTTIAGTTAGYTDGEAAKSRFNRPWGIDVDAAGRLFVADRNNARIRRISGGLTVTVAGFAGGYVDGSISVARFNAPQGVLALPNGNVVVGDSYNHRIRHVQVTASACSIDGACWANGTANPAKPCEVCNGATSPTKWDASACTK